jgi:perosamine synthetase
MRKDLIPVVNPWITFIEEAAEAIGSEYHGNHSASFGDTGVFNFHGSKTMTIGEGGMLITEWKHHYGRCLALRDYGIAPCNKMFWNEEVD